MVKRLSQNQTGDFCSGGMDIPICVNVVIVANGASTSEAHGQNMVGAYFIKVEYINCNG
jgi:hypothetical protein